MLSLNSLFPFPNVEAEKGVLSFIGLHPPSKGFSFYPRRLMNIRLISKANVFQSEGHLCLSMALAWHTYTAIIKILSSRNSYGR
jgi:hypothetical protein